MTFGEIKDLHEDYLRLANDKSCSCVFGRWTSYYRKHLQQYIDLTDALGDDSNYWIPKLLQYVQCVTDKQLPLSALGRLYGVAPNGQVDEQTHSSFRWVGLQEWKSLGTLRCVMSNVLIRYPVMSSTKLHLVFDFNCLYRSAVDDIISVAKLWCYFTFNELRTVVLNHFLKWKIPAFTTFYIFLFVDSLYVNYV